jgi:hypothetical protein
MCICYLSSRRDYHVAKEYFVPGVVVSPFCMRQKVHWFCSTECMHRYACIEQGYRSALVFIGMAQIDALGARHGLS